MKVYVRQCRMFIRTQVEDRSTPCTGCAGLADISLCQVLPRCTGDKASIFKEVIYKEKRDA